jgi:spore coat protein U-like protein
MKRSRLVVVAVMAAAVAVLGGRAVSAASNTANMTVQATVVANCTITANSLLWSSFDTVTGQGADATTTLSIACTKGATPTVQMGSGLHAGTTRNMQNGSDLLAYDIYTSSTFDTVWNGTSTVALIPAPSKAPRSMNVYGRIVATNDVPAGTYSDTVVSTVNF